MVNDDMEQKIYDFIRPRVGTYFLNYKEQNLTPETDLDSDLNFDEYDIEDLMAEYFKEFKVDSSNFNVNVYYPDVPISWNPFKKTVPVQVPAFTIEMLIESAKAGRWLYD